ncbi:MAG: ABC transporter substrate-binding protein [Bacilli bacterium]|jgi:putative ABC transport system substrate-binding protein
MKKLKTLCLASIAVMASTVSLASCSSGHKIGVLQLATFDALDKVVAGFKSTLDANHVDYTLTIQNPELDESKIPSMASSLVLGNDMVLGIATSTSQALKKAAEDRGKEMPVLFSAVTDPIGANLVPQAHQPGGNVTGCSDMGPVNESIDLLSTYFEGIDNVACLYNVSESNSIQQVDIAQARIESKEWTFTDAGINDVNLVESTINSLADGVDAIYIPTDNTIASSIASVAKAAKNRHFIVICGDVGMVETGGILGLGVDYFNLGEQVGAMAVQILVDGIKAGDIDVGYATEFPLSVNARLAAEWGITLSQALLDAAAQEGNILIQ